MPPPTTGQRLNNRKILQILASLNHSVEQVDFRFTSKEILNGFESKIRFLLHEVNLFFLSLRKVAITDLVYLPIHQSLGRSSSLHAIFAYHFIVEQKVYH